MKGRGTVSQLPNILLIVADDMYYGDLGVFNDGMACTSHLDALIYEDVRLSQNYPNA